MTIGILSGSRLWLGVALLGLLIAMGLFVGTFKSQGLPPEEARLTIGTKDYSVKVVSSQADREKGLSGTESLPTGRGMLFIFPSNEKWGIWMKDMKYPIDIVWFDEAKKVVDMVAGATPESYPETTFKPKQPARYILELKAGSIEEASISVGSQADFAVNVSGGRE